MLRRWLHHRLGNRSRVSEGAENRAEAAWLLETKIRVKIQDMTWKFSDLTGRRFGRLTVLNIIRGKKIRWRCLCDCGTFTTSRTSHLKDGGAQSCGCLRRIIPKLMATHGAHKTRTYSSWSSMRSRCLNPNHNGYEKYGRRGITICERWNKFENFFSDMGERPPNTSLGRINNERGYSPENCRWETLIQQHNNKRNNAFIEFRGRRMTIAQLAREFGLPYPRVCQRIQTWGWTPEEAVTLPPSYANKIYRRALLRA